MSESIAEPSAAPDAERTARDPDPARARLAKWALLALVLLCCVPTLGFQLLEWDDPLHVSRNPLVLAPERMPLRAHWLTPELGYPIPVTVASYRLDHALFGPSAWGFHLDNLLLHLAACLLAWRLARVLGLTVSGTMAAVALFALHPASAEPVSWISGRKDLLAAVLVLATLLLARGSGLRARAAGVVCYALALLSKPVVAPLVVLLPGLVPADRFAGTTADAGIGARLKAGSKLLWPYLLVLVPIALLGVAGQRSAGALQDGAGELSPLRAALFALGHHARIALLWEEPTAKYIPAPWPPPWPGSVEIASGLLLALLALALLRIRGPAQGAVRFGAAFAALAYLPSSSLFFPLSRYLADSYLYLPLLGLGLVLGGALDHAQQLSGARVQRLCRLAPWLLALALAPAFVLSSARFADDLALWSHARGRFPNHPRVCREWSNAVFTERGPALGLQAIDTCIAEFGDALFVKNRGLALAQVGRYAEARIWLERAAKTAPGDSTIARALGALPP